MYKLVGANLRTQPNGSQTREPPKENFDSS